MKRRCFSAFLILTASAPFIFAQQTHTPPTPAQIVANRVARLTTLLTLSTTQQTQATMIFTTEQTALSGLVANMKSDKTALKTAVQANDTASISAEATQIGNLTAQEVAARATADAQFYGMLTSTQQTKYQQLSGSGRFGNFAARGRR